jgi:hypothetical protein
MATKAIARRRTRTVIRRVGHRAQKMTIPLAIVGGLVPMGADILLAFKVGGAEAALGHVSLCTTGYDPADGQWKPMFAAKKLYGPLLLGAFVHKAAGQLGVNRMLAKTGIPLLRI